MARIENEPKRKRGRPRRSADAAAEERARILAVAQRLFAEGGYEGVSMRAVAAEAGLSPAALYTLFPHKRAMLRNIWEDAFALLDAALERAARKRDPMARLAALGRAFVGFWLEHPEHFRAIFLIEDKVTEPGERYFAETSESVARLAALFRTAVEEAIGEGRIEGEAAAVVDLIFAGLLGVSSGLVSIPEFGWRAPGRMAGRMIDTLLKGFAPA